MAGKRCAVTPNDERCGAPATGQRTIDGTRKWTCDPHNPQNMGGRPKGQAIALPQAWEDAATATLTTADLRSFERAAERRYSNLESQDATFERAIRGYVLRTVRDGQATGETDPAAAMARIDATREQRVAAACMTGDGRSFADRSRVESHETPERQETADARDLVCETVRIVELAKLSGHRLAADIIDAAQQGDHEEVQALADRLADAMA